MKHDSYSYITKNTKILDLACGKDKFLWGLTVELTCEFAKGRKRKREREKERKKGGRLYVNKNISYHSERL
jgi:hypothetical protein